ITNMRLFGLSLVNGSDNNLVKDISISHASSSGFNIVYNCSFNEVKNLDVSFCGENPPPDFNSGGVGILASSNNLLVDIKTYSNSNGIGFATDPETNEASLNNQIRNLEAFDNSEFGMFLQPGSESNLIKDSEITGNQCDLKDEGTNNLFINSQIDIICN
ncbi:MAG: right-handed parallel beta-helix repeat-containing protein, partial [Eudoraea sp.]|nr:right-handed parallel beta-helix repeat-containing protein [Eudoraea sp.]